ncbi:MAG: NAD(P)H-hydrate dehydratase [Deltaproteobacteria bacterium]|nr:NAD(P)H-hydrate dehydratase [Deltaproteobacteria bacterium]
MKVSSVTEMRDLDRTAIETFGIREEILMENAGDAVYAVMRDRFGIAGKRFVIFCGLGNNGGDGFVVARKVHSNGGDARVFILGDKNRFKGAAGLNLDIIAGMPLDVKSIEDASEIRWAVSHCDVIVDAVFGTGLARDVGGLYGDVIDAVNESGKPVIGVDIPSGVNGDTGHVMGKAVSANVTVSFGLPKIGNLLYPGYALCGDLYVTHISFPPSLHDADALKVEINHPPPLPPRTAWGHKGDFGDVLFVSGAADYYGAPYFAALSFMKAGGGYSRLAAPHSVIPAIAAKGNEMVFVPMAETTTGSIGMENLPSLMALSEKADMVVVGPGLSLDAETRELVLSLVGGIAKPLLIDGDGISAVCDNPDMLKGRRAETILTPHLGEMSRIAGRPVADIDADKVAVLQKTAAELGCYVVLKGAHSLVGYPDERVFINMTGNSGMATAGSGDVLTGTIAAMFGLGLPIGDAVRKGVFVHGLAGDLAAEETGADGITAQTILDALPKAMKADREGLPGRFYGVRVV